MKVQLLDLPKFLGLGLKSMIGYCSMVPTLMYPGCEDLFIVRIKDMEVPCFESDFQILGEDDDKTEAIRNVKEQIDATNLRLDLAKDMRESGLVVVEMENGRYKSFDVFTSKYSKIEYNDSVKKINLIRFIIDFCEEEKIPFIICDKKRPLDATDDSRDYFSVEFKNCIKDGTGNIDASRFDDFVLSVIAMQVIAKGWAKQKELNKKGEQDEG